MKKQKKNGLLLTALLSASALIVGTVSAYLLAGDERDNYFKVGEPVNNTVYYRIMDSKKLNNVDGGDAANIVFDKGILPMFEGQTFFFDYNSSKYALTDEAYASKVTLPNGFFLNSYYYKEHDAANDLQFINAPTTYNAVFDDGESVDLQYYRKLIESDTGVTAYDIGVKSDSGEPGRSVPVYWGKAKTETQGATPIEVYYDFEPVDFTIKFDLNPDHMKDGNYQGYPEISSQDINDLNLIPDSKTVTSSAGQTFTRYYYSSYNVLKGMAFPEASWNGGMQYEFLGWRIVSDDHYDVDTDEYTNFNYKENEANHNISDEEYVHGVNCWVSYANNPVYLDANGNPSYYMNGETRVDLTQEQKDKLTKDNYFYQLDKKIGEKTVRYYYSSYKGDSETPQTELRPLQYLTNPDADSKTAVTNEPIYSTEEVLTLLNKRSTGNIELQAQWAVPDLVVTFDTSYIQAKFGEIEENGVKKPVFTNQLTYKWNNDSNRYELASGVYKEPTFSFRGWMRDQSNNADGTLKNPDGLVKYDISNSPYIQFWTTDKHLDTTDPASGDWTVDSDPLFQMKLNDARDGMATLADGSKVYINTAVVGMDYPTNEADAKKFYGFMKETVYDGDSIQEINIANLLNENRIVPYYVDANGNKIADPNNYTDTKTKVYGLSVYGYIKPMVILQTAPEVDIVTERDNGYTYNNSGVEFDYVANETVLGTKFSYHRASFTDDYLDNLFDPRIDEKQTGDRGWVTDGTAGQNGISRGKMYSIPSKRNVNSSAGHDSVFTGYQTYYYDNGRDPSKESGLDYDTTENHFFTLQEMNIVTGELGNDFISKNSPDYENGAYITRVTNHRYALKSNFDKFDSTKIFIRPIWDNDSSSYFTLKFNKGTDGAPNGSMYDITFDRNTTNNDIKGNLPNCTFTNVNYHFKYWAYGSVSGEKMTTFDQVLAKAGSNAKTATLYAVWEADGFNIAYLANDASATPEKVDPDKLRKTTSLTTQLTGNVKNNPFTVDGKSFVAWNTNPDGTGVFYFPGQVVYESDRNMKYDSETKFNTLTLYAMWTKYAVTFDANGETGEDGKPDAVFSDGKDENKVYYAGLVPANEYNLDYIGLYETPVRGGYKFVGWSATKDGTKTDAVDSNDGKLKAVLTADVTYYALWEPYDVPVYFSPNGGYGSITSERIDEKGELPLKSQKTLQGMTPPQGFTNYKKDANGNIIYVDLLDENGDVVKDDDGNVIRVPDTMVLAGWALSPTGEMFIEDGGLLTYNDVLAEYKELTGREDYNVESITLYAVWADRCTVTFDPNGGTGTQKIKYTDEFGSINIPDAAEYDYANGRYIFLGWSDEKEGWTSADADFYKAGENASFYQNTTLYAQWFYYKEDFPSDKILNDYHLSSNWTKVVAEDEKLVAINDGLDLNGTSANIIFNRYGTELGDSYIAEATVRLNGAACSFGFTTADNTMNVFKMESTDGKEFTLSDGSKITLNKVDHKIQVVFREGNAYVYIDDTLVETHEVSGTLYGAYASGNLTVDDLSVYNMDMLTTVTFHAGEGTGADYTEDIYFAPYTVKNPSKFTAPTGQSFSGWETADGVQYAVGTKIPTEEMQNITSLTALWEKQYTIEYYKDETLVGSTDYFASTLPDTVTLATRPDTNTQKFLGWQYVKESSDEPFMKLTKEDILAKADTDGVVKLYAQWEEKDPEIIYRNTITGEKTEPIKRNDLTNGDEFVFEKDNKWTNGSDYLIVGWKADDGTIYPPEYKVTVDNDFYPDGVTFETVWGKKSSQLSSTSSWIVPNGRNVSLSNVTNGVRVNNLDTSENNNGAYFNFSGITSGNISYTFETDFQAQYAQSGNRWHGFGFYTIDDSLIAQACYTSKEDALKNSIFSLYGNVWYTTDYHYTLPYISGETLDTPFIMAHDGYNATGYYHLKMTVDGDKAYFSVTKRNSTEKEVSSQLQSTDLENIKGFWTLLTKKNSSRETFFEATNTYIYLPTAPTAPITLDSGVANSGMQTLESYGGSFTIPDCPFTYAGHIFAGWTGSDGNNYAVGDKINNLTGDLTLTAQWETAYTIRLHSNPDEDTTKDITVLTSDLPYPVSSITHNLENDGHRVVKWKDADGNVYDAGINGLNPELLLPTDKNTITEDAFDTDMTLDLYAQWSYKVTYYTRNPAGNYWTLNKSDVVQNLTRGMTLNNDGSIYDSKDNPVNVEYYGRVPVESKTTSEEIKVTAATDPNTYFRLYGWYLYTPITSELTDDSGATIVNSTDRYIRKQRNSWSLTNIMAYSEAKAFVFNTDLKLPENYDSNENIILYPIWQQEEVTTTITFDANGGEGTMDTQTIIGTASLNKNQFTRGHYDFLGWSESANATTETYADEQSVGFPKTDVTLYAVWKEYPKVTFQPNGNKNTKIPLSTLYPEKQNDGSYLVTIPAFTNDTEYDRASTGWYFDCWQDANNTTITYNPEESIVLTEDITLNAIWTNVIANIYFDANGGSFTQSTTNGYAGYSGQLLLLEYMHQDVRQGYSKHYEVPTKNDGSIFAGWEVVAERNRGSSGSLSYTNSQNYTISDEGVLNKDAAYRYDLIFKAKWSTGTITVTFNSNGGIGTMTPQTFTAKGTLNANTFTKTGYKFMGWATSAAGEVVYTDGAEITPTEDMTLYAVWEEKFTTYNVMDGSGNVLETIEVKYSDTTFNTLSLPYSYNDFSKAGYIFTGWKSTENTKYTLSDELRYVEGKEEITIEPQWQQFTWNKTNSDIVITNNATLNNVQANRLRAAWIPINLSEHSDVVQVDFDYKITYSTNYTGLQKTSIQFLNQNGVADGSTDTTQTRIIAKLESAATDGLSNNQRTYSTYKHNSGTAVSTGIVLTGDTQYHISAEFDYNNFVVNMTISSAGLTPVTTSIPIVDVTSSTGDKWNETLNGIFFGISSKDTVVVENISVIDVE